MSLEFAALDVGVWQQNVGLLGWDVAAGGRGAKLKTEMRVCVYCVLGDIEL